MKALLIIHTIISQRQACDRVSLDAPLSAFASPHGEEARRRKRLYSIDLQWIPLKCDVQHGPACIRFVRPVLTDLEQCGAAGGSGESGLLRSARLWTSSGAPVAHTENTPRPG